jgi:hypothetical protein
MISVKHVDGQEALSEELSRPADWIPLELKPKLTRLSEEGERKLEEERLDAWARDQTEYEERERTLIDQNREQRKLEEEIRTARQREEEADEVARRKEEAERQEQLRALRQQAEMEFRRRAWLTAGEAAREEQETRGIPTEVEAPVEERLRVFRQRVDEEKARRAQLSERSAIDERRTLER